MIVDNKTKPNFSILEHLIKEIKDFKITDIEKINYLKNLYSDSEKFINEIKKCNNKNDLDKIEEEIKNKSIVDLNDFIIEQSVKIKMGVLEEKEEEEEKKLLKKKRKSSNLETKSEDKISINENNENNNENNNKINNENNETYHSNKRNIKRKIDTDFEYDKDFINEFDNKIANREINNNNNKKEENEENEEEINTSSKTKEKNNNNNNKNKININLFEKKEQKFLTKKKSNQTQEKSNEIDTLKISIKKNAIFSLENSLKENIYFNSKKDFIQSLSKTLELELSKLHPNYDENYTKTLNNMIKNIKELNKYKRVSFLVFKNKINLFKISKFPHGPKFIDKLKHIENHKKNNTTNENLLKNVNELYDSLDKKNNLKLEKKLSNFSNISSSLIEDNNTNNTNNNYFDDDNNSLHSLNSNENIKFSPTTKEENNNNQSILTAEKDEYYDPLEIILKNDFFNNNNYNNNNKKYIIFPVFFNPYLKSEFLLENENNHLPKNIQPGSLLQIYKGKLHITHSKFPEIIFYSTNSFNKFLFFPELPISNSFNNGINENEIIITGKTLINEVVPYVNKNLKNSNKILLFGWAECDDKNLNVFKNNLIELDKQNKCGCLKFNNCKLYVFPINKNNNEEFYNKISKNFDIVNDSIFNFDIKLIWVLIANKSDLSMDKRKSDDVNQGKLVPKVIKEGKKKEENNNNNNEIDENDENNNNDNNLSKKESIVIQQENENNNNNNNNNNENNNNENNNENNNNNNENNNNNKENNNNNNNNNNENEEDENTKLENIFKSNDIQSLKEYLDKNFNQLSQDQIYKKLMTLKEENRDKLLEIIQNSGLNDK